MIRIIVNADDLGKSQEVNAAIADAFRNRYITSSTILANSAYWDEIHRIVEENVDVSFGVHLNLTEGKAITNNQILLKYGIVDNDNLFTANVLKLKCFPKELVQAIYEEWDAQIHKVCVIEGINVSHLDGHHHVHTIMAFARILCKLGEKYNIHKVRNRYYYSRGKLFDFLRIIIRLPFLSNVLYVIGKKGKVTQLLQREAETALWQKHIKTTYGTTDYFNAYESQVSLLSKKVGIPSGLVIELMCHPGHQKYDSEYQMIKECVIENYLPVLYINYREFR